MSSLDTAVRQVATEAAKEAVRAELVADGALVSQRSSLAVVGIPPRTFLELLRRRDCPLDVVHLGKLRLVRREALLAWLERIGAPRRPEEPEADLDGADRVLVECGLRPVAGDAR